MRHVSILVRIIISVVVILALSGVAAAYFVYINHLSHIKEREADLKKNVEIVITMLLQDRELQKNSGKSRDEIDQENYKKISAAKFGDNNHFNIYEGTVLRFNRIRPYLAGKDMRNYTDADGRHPVLRFVTGIAAYGEISIRYKDRYKNTVVPLAKLGYATGIPGTKYWIGTGVFIQDLENLFWQRIFLVCLGVFLLLTIFVAIAFYLSNSITKPLFLVRKRMIALANGDASSEVPEIHSKDEIGEMARAVEVFRKNRRYTSELEVINSRIEKQALHDPLTGLANRRYFEAYFIELQERLSLNGDSIKLLHIDLDLFKEVNDTFGHATGDLILKHTADVLKQKADTDDFIARIGGDEFLIIGPYYGDLACVESQVRNINAALAEPVPYEGRFCRFGASIGVAFQDAENADIEVLTGNADIALYHAKELGRNRFEIYSDKLRSDIVAKSRTIEEFLDGMDMGQLIPYYQPQFDIHTLDLIGIEVLARWVHPERGVLKPGFFLDIAEDQKVLANINQAIAMQALRDCVRLQARNISIPRLAINFSSDSLEDPELCSWLEKMLPFPVPFAIELVGTSSFEKGNDIIQENLTRLKEMGVEIEVDDFGSGQASILGLLQVHPDRIKIDQKLVAPVPDSKVHEDFVRSIVDMARSINVPTIAEGVETLDHVRCLRELGVDAFQGYALAEPMRYSELSEFLVKQSWLKVA